MSRLPPDGNLRPELADSLGERPRRLGAHPLLAVMVRAGLPLRTVPEDYWRQATDLAGHAQAVIDCTCGERPIVELGAYPVACEGCQRWFFYDGAEVLALNSPSE